MDARNPGVRWYASPDEGRLDTTPVAWVFALPSAAAGLEPTPRDLAEIGDRKGADVGRFLSRRAALRGLVARCCGVAPATVAIGYGAAGRPLVLAPADLFCSVSARGDIAAFALARHPVGVDLEILEPGDIPWAVLAAAETAWLRTRPTAEQAARFLEIWTLKEAYLKAGGSGLLVDPAATDVSIPTRTIRSGRETLGFDRSALHRATVGGHPIVAACVTRPHG